MQRRWQPNQPDQGTKTGGGSLRRREEGKGDAFAGTNDQEGEVRKGRWLPLVCGWSLLAFLSLFEEQTPSFHSFRFLAFATFALVISPV